MTEINYFKDQALIPEHPLPGWQLQQTNNSRDSSRYELKVNIAHNGKEQFNTKMSTTYNNWKQTKAVEPLTRVVDQSTHIKTTGQRKVVKKLILSDIKTPKLPYGDFNYVSYKADKIYIPTRHISNKRTKYNDIPVNSKLLNQKKIPFFKIGGGSSPFSLLEKYNLCNDKRYVIEREHNVQHCNITRQDNRFFKNLRNHQIKQCKINKTIKYNKTISHDMPKSGVFKQRTKLPHIDEDLEDTFNVSLKGFISNEYCALSIPNTVKNKYKGFILNSSSKKRVFNYKCRENLKKQVRFSSLVVIDEYHIKLEEKREKHELVRSKVWIPCVDKDTTCDYINEYRYDYRRSAEFTSILKYYKLVIQDYVPIFKPESEIIFMKKESRKVKFQSYEGQGLSQKMMMEDLVNPNHTPYGQGLVKLRKRTQEERGLKNIKKKKSVPKHGRAVKFLDKTRDVHLKQEGLKLVVETTTGMAFIHRYILPAMDENFKKGNFTQLFMDFLWGIYIVIKKEVDRSICAHLGDIVNKIKSLFKEYVVTLVDDITKKKIKGMLAFPSFLRKKKKSSEFTGSSLQEVGEDGEIHDLDEDENFIRTGIMNAGKVVGYVKGMFTSDTITQLPMGERVMDEIICEHFNKYDTTNIERYVETLKRHVKSVIVNNHLNAREYLRDNYGSELSFDNAIEGIRREEEEDNNLAQEGIAEMLDFLCGFLDENYITRLIRSDFSLKLLNCFSGSVIIGLLHICGVTGFDERISKYISEINLQTYSLTSLMSTIHEFFISFLPNIFTGEFGNTIDVKSDWFIRSQHLVKYGQTLNTLGDFKVTALDDRPVILRAQDYLREVDSQKKSGVKLLRMMNDTNFMKSKLQNMLAELEMAYMNITALSNAYELRPAPFVIHAFGPPRLGKSTKLNQIAKVVGEELVFDYNDQFQVSFGAKHMDGYSNQAILDMDDFGQCKSEELASSAAQLFVDAAGNKKKIVQMAALEDKGRVMLNAKMIYVTSNMPNANVPALFTDTVAILARLKHVVEYKTCIYSREIIERMVWWDETPIALEVGVRYVLYHCYTREVSVPEAGDPEIYKKYAINTFDYRVVCRWMKERAKEWKTDQMNIVGIQQTPLNFMQLSTVGIMARKFVPNPMAWMIPVPLPAFIFQTPVSTAIYDRSVVTDILPVLTQDENDHNDLSEMIGESRDRDRFSMANYPDVYGYVSYIPSIMISPLLQHGILGFIGNICDIYFPLFAFPVRMAVILLMVRSEQKMANRCLEDNTYTPFMTASFIALADTGYIGIIGHFVYNLLYCVFVLPYVNTKTNIELLTKRSYLPIVMAVGSAIGLMVISTFLKPRVSQEVLGEPVSKEDEDMMMSIDTRIGTSHHSTVESRPRQQFIVSDKRYLPKTGIVGRREKIKRCTVTLTIIGDQEYKTKGIGILTGNFIITAAHCIPEGKFEVNFLFGTRTYSFYLGPGNIMKFKDLGVMHIMQPIAETLDVNYFAPMLNGKHRLIHTDVEFSVYANAKDEYSIYNCSYELGEKTRAGFSGSPIVYEDRYSVVITAIHCASDSEMCGDRKAMGRGVSFCKEVIDWLRGTHNGNIWVNQESYVSGDGITPLPLTELHPKSILRYFDDVPGIIPLGTISHKSSPSKSRFITTFYIDQFAQIKEKYTIPDFTSRVKVEDGHEVWINPFVVNLCEVGTHTNLRNHDITQAIVKYIAKRLIDTQKFELEQPIDMKSAVNGIPGILSSIDLSTSGGPGFSGDKAKWVSGEHPNLVPHKNVLQSINNYITLIESGISPRFLFKASLKDEILSHAKNDVGRVRMFCGSSFPMIVLYRMMFGPFFVWMMRNRHEHPWKIGINATSLEWDAMINKLKRFSRFYESDFKFYDKRNGLLEVAISIMVEVMSLSGYSEKHVLFSRLLGSGCANYDLLIEGCIAFLSTMAPSGVSGTTYFNCLVELFLEVLSLVLSYAEEHNEKLSAETLEKCMKDYDFFDNVELANYGDDNIKSMSENIVWHTDERHFRNMSALSMELTRADKKPGFPTSCNDIETCGFLKRKFYFNDDLGQYTAPLDEESIYKMMCFREDKGTLSELEYVIIAANEANRQFFLAGKEKFDEFNRILKDATPSIVYDRFNLDSYDKLKEIYLTDQEKPFIVWSI